MSPTARLAAKRAAVYLAAGAAPPATVLDVAAGHGFYGIELAKAFPEAVVTAVDWPSVLELASANARDAGVGERFRVVAGNAFEVDWGGEFDLVILANFLHHFSPEECATILRKVKSSLSRRRTSLRRRVRSGRRSREDAHARHVCLPDAGDDSRRRRIHAQRAMTKLQKRQDSVARPLARFGQRRSR